MKIRILSIVLTICMVLMLLPITVFAAETLNDISYLDASGAQKTRYGATVVTSEITTWRYDSYDGWYVVNRNVTIGSNITVIGNVHLILMDGCSLTVNGNIAGGSGNTVSGSSLTIYGQAGGTGTIDVSGNINGGPGIDGNYVNSGSGGGGSVTINGGVVEVGNISGGNGGSTYGIAGSGGAGGSVTINSGTVNVYNSITGGSGGAGSGEDPRDSGNGGTGGSVTINGGTVTATNINGGPGGSGGYFGNGGAGGCANIYSGTVTVTQNITGGNGGGSGIYSGNGGAGGSVTINGGIVFHGNGGQVYGTSFTLSGNFTIPDGKTLTIDSGKTLIIPDNVTLTNDGKIYVDGTFTGTADNLYYPLTIKDATASGDTSEYNSKNYGKAGSTITLTPYTMSTGYKLCGWDVSPANTLTMVGENTYTITMPKEALTITAQFKDITAPAISGIEDDKTYCDNVEFTVSDNDGIASVKAGDTVLTPDTNGKYTLAKGIGTVTVVVTDNAGNTAQVSVTVNNGHTYEWQSENGQYWKKCKFCGDETAKKDIPTITIDAPDTVCRTQDYKFSFTLPEDATDAVYGYEFENKGNDGLPAIIENNELFGIVPVTEYEPSENSFKVYAGAKTADGFEFFVSKTVKIQNEHAGGVATCVELAICDTCGEHYGELDSTNHNLEKVPAKAATVTETGNEEYWHCKDCGKYFADENGENEIALADTVTQKLPPEIIEGKGQSVTEGEKKDLTFRSNAAFSDFIRARLDGKTLDEKDYTVKEGSTVVTLKADYVATLSAGEHTIGIVLTSGTATTAFTVNAKAVADNDTKSPKTGDNSHIALWIALLFVSGGLLTVTGVFGKRKNTLKTKN